MRKLLAFVVVGGVLVLALGVAAASADVWTRTYGHGRDAMGHRVLLLADGGLLVVGEMAVGNGEMDARALLLRLDPTGGVVWEKTYTEGRTSSGSALLAMDDGGYLVAGTALSDDGDDADILLLSIDANGNQVWAKSYGTQLNEYGGAFLRTADGGYVILGNSVDPNDFVADAGAAGYSGFDGRSNTYVLKIDSEGNEVWSCRYTTTDNVIASGGAIAPDDGIVVLTHRLRFPIDDNDIVLMKLDSDGNEVWSKTWTEGDASGYDLIATRDGGYAISGMLADPGDPELEKGDALLIRVDADGNELWSRTYGKPDKIETAHVILEMSAGRIVCVGWQEESFDEYGDDRYVACFSADGTPLWERVTTTSAHNLYEGLVEYPDGTLIIAGSAAQPGRVFRVQVIKTEAAETPGG